MTITARKLAVLASLAVMAFGSVSVAEARHGADDPVKELRGGKRADDPQPHARRGADDAKPHAHTGTHKRCARRGHGADDPQPHARRGADDAAPRTRCNRRSHS